MEYSWKTLNLMADLHALTRSEHETEQDRAERVLKQQSLHKQILHAALEDAAGAVQDVLRHRRPYPVKLHQNAFILARGPLATADDSMGAEPGDYVVTVHHGTDRLNMVLEPELYAALFEEVPQPKPEITPDEPSSG